MPTLPALLILAAALATPALAKTTATPAATDIPKIDVTPSCHAAANEVGPVNAKTTMDGCMKAEDRARQQLVDEWPQFTQADRRMCYATVRGFDPTYSEFVTCLEMERDLRHPPSQAAQPTAGTGTSAGSEGWPATQTNL
jgi:hypothetical protein